MVFHLRNITDIHQGRYFIFLTSLKESSLKESFFKTFRGFNKLDSCSYYFEISYNVKIFISIKNYSDEVS